jgi:protein disulfide-isomerase A1
MKKYIAVLLIALFFVCINAGGEDVLVLTDKNFDEEVKNHEFILVEFYAPWCGHCKALQPEYDAAATKLKGQIVVAKIDCDANRGAAEKNEIQGFPTIKLFKNGKAYKEYEGERTATAIVNWVKKKTGPVAKELKTQEEIDAFVKENEGTAIVGYFKNKECEEYKQYINYLETDNTFEDFAAGEVFESSLVSDAPFLKLYRSFDEEITTKDFKNAKEWLATNGYPLLEEISARNFRRFVESGVPLAVLFLDYSKQQECEKVKKIIENVASSRKGKMNWVYSNGVEYKEQLEAMGGTGDIPAIAAMDLDKRQNFPYNGEFTEEKITEWVDGVVSGKIKPYYRSDPIPEKQEGPVTVVVGKTYESIVMDTTKDVLLEFYAPWCGHCKAMEPKYDALGEYFKGIDSVVIAKIDATSNDTPYPIEGFPTVVFFPGNKKESPIPYEGDRSLKDMVEFVKKHATVSKDAITALNKPITELFRGVGEEAPKDEL